MRLLHLAGFLAAAGLVFGSCKCGGNNNGGDDGGLDGGVDAGPTHCETTADCAAAGMADLVCDPQEKVCVAKCGSDSDCTYVASGICEPSDGTCRLPCGTMDYCPTVGVDAGTGNMVCREQTGHCVKKCTQ